MASWQRNKHGLWHPQFSQISIRLSSSKVLHQSGCDVLFRSGRFGLIVARVQQKHQDLSSGHHKYPQQISWKCVSWKVRGHQNPFTQLWASTQDFMAIGQQLTIWETTFPTGFLILRCVARREISDFVSTTPNSLTTPKVLVQTEGGLYEKLLPCLLLCVEEWQGCQCESDPNTPCSFRNHHRRRSSVPLFAQWPLCVFNDADIAETPSAVVVRSNVAATALKTSSLWHSGDEALHCGSLQRPG